MAHFLMAFDDIDKKGTGIISIEDVRNYMKKENYQENFLQNFFKLFDLNTDGVITLDEYCTALGINGKSKDKILLRRASRSNAEILKINDRFGWKDVEVLSSDMNNGEQSHIIEICRDILLKYHDQSDIAEELKQKLDEEFGRLWHVIVGIGRYGSNISNEKYSLLHFKLSRFSFLIWKTNDDYIK